MDPIQKQFLNPMEAGLAPLAPKAPGVDEAGKATQDFGKLLKDSLKQVSMLEQEAQQATQTYAVGGPVELHQVMIAQERAELSLELAVQVRNKLIQAYQEISRMPV